MGHDFYKYTTKYVPYHLFRKIRPMPSLVLFIWGVFNIYGMLSCLYAKFLWLTSHVQLSFQPITEGSSRATLKIPALFNL